MSSKSRNRLRLRIRPLNWERARVRVEVGRAPEHRSRTFVVVGIVMAKGGRQAGEDVGADFLEFLGVKHVIAARGEEFGDLRLQALEPLFGQGIAGKTPRELGVKRD